MKVVYDYEPMDFATMRSLGARSLSGHCHRCHHDVVMNADRWLARTQSYRRVLDWQEAGLAFTAMGRGAKSQRANSLRFPRLFRIISSHVRRWVSHQFPTTPFARKGRHRTAA